MKEGVNLLNTKRESLIAARQKPSKKRSVLNMATSTEKATARPKASTDNTDTRSTGIRPNLRERAGGRG